MIRIGKVMLTWNELLNLQIDKKVLIVHIIYAFYRQTITSKHLLIQNNLIKYPLMHKFLDTGMYICMRLEINWLKHFLTIFFSRFSVFVRMCKHTIHCKLNVSWLYLNSTLSNSLHYRGWDIYNDMNANEKMVVGK